MTSSGQHVTSRVIHAECDGMTGHTALAGTPLACRWEWPCTFAGDVDLYIDPESRLAAWTCDTCGTHHPVEYDEVAES